MKKQSTARKFQLITGKDLFSQQKRIQKVTESEEENVNVNDVMEFVQYGLFLALYETNLPKAKADFEEYLETYEFDTNGLTLVKLFETWSKEIK